MNPEWTQEHRNKGIREVPRDILEWANIQEFRESPPGALIASVTDHSPGAVAGLKKGDTVLSLDGDPVLSSTFSQQFQVGNGKVRILDVLGQDGSRREVFITPVWIADVGRWVIGVSMVIDEHRDNLRIPEGEKHRRIPFELGASLREKVRGYVEISKSKDVKESARVLSRYVLFFTGKDGRSMEVDLLERWNMQSVECVVDPDLSPSGSYDFASRRVSVRMLVEALTPHVLAHEYRHVDQNENPSFRSAMDLYESVSKKKYEDPAHWTKKIRSGGWKILARAFVEGGIVKTFEEAKPYIQSVKERFDEYDQAVQALEELIDGESNVKDQLRIGAAKQIKSLLDERVWSAFIANVNSENGLASSFGGVRVEFNGVDSQELDGVQREDLLKKLRTYVALDAFFQIVSVIRWDQAVLDPSTNCLILSRPSMNLRLAIPLREEVSQEAEKVIKDMQETLRMTIDDYELKLDLAREAKRAAFESLPDASTEVVESLTVRDILRLPTLRIERDAEYGALVALRSLKKDTGIDLLGSGEEVLVMMEERQGVPPSLQLAKMTSSLGQIENYMAKIGVSIPCVRKVIVETRKQRKEKEREEVQREAA